MKDRLVQLTRLDNNTQFYLFMPNARIFSIEKYGDNNCQVTYFLGNSDHLIATNLVEPVDTVVNLFDVYYKKFGYGDWGHGTQGERETTRRAA